MKGRFSDSKIDHSMLPILEKRKIPEHPGSPHTSRPYSPFPHVDFRPASRLRRKEVYCLRSFFLTGPKRKEIGVETFRIDYLIRTPKVEKLSLQPISFEKDLQNSL